MLNAATWCPDTTVHNYLGSAASKAHQDLAARAKKLEHYIGEGNFAKVAGNMEGLCSGLMLRLNQNLPVCGSSVQIGATANTVINCRLPTKEMVTLKTGACDTILQLWTAAVLLQQRARDFELVYSPYCVAPPVRSGGVCVGGGARGGRSRIDRSMSSVASCAGKCHNPVCAPCKRWPAAWCTNGDEEEKQTSEATCTRATWCPVAPSALSCAPLRVCNGTPVSRR